MSIAESFSPARGLKIPRSNGVRAPTGGGEFRPVDDLRFLTPEARDSDAVGDSRSLESPAPLLRRFFFVVSSSSESCRKRGMLFSFRFRLAFTAAARRCGCAESVTLSSECEASEENTGTPSEEREKSRSGSDERRACDGEAGRDADADAVADIDKDPSFERSRLDDEEEDADASGVLTALGKASAFFQWSFFGFGDTMGRSLLSRLTLR